MNFRIFFWHYCLNIISVAYLPIISLRIYKLYRHYKLPMNNPNDVERLLKLLIIGNSGVGKSCLLMRYCENNFTTAFYNTIGVDFKMKNIELDGRKVRMQIWDTAGQDRFRTITSSYYKGAHGIMLVFDVTDRESFDALRYWQQEIDKYASEGVNRIIIGNKTDQVEKRKVSYEQAYDYAKNQKIEYIEVSALNANHIAEAFEILARNVLKRLTDLPFEKKKLPPVGSTKQLATGNKKNNSGGCC